MTTRPRIRTIKPEIWQNEKVGQVSLPARLLFVGLITMADDYGRLRALLPAILGHVFPYDELATGKVRKWLDELELVSLIVRYEVGGKPYIQVVGWDRHQKVNRKAERSELPSPPGHDAFTESSVNGAGVGS